MSKPEITDEMRQALAKIIFDAEMVHTGSQVFGVFTTSGSIYLAVSEDGYTAHITNHVWRNRELQPSETKYGVRASVESRDSFLRLILDREDEAPFLTSRIEELLKHHQAGLFKSHRIETSNLTP